MLLVKFARERKRNAGDTTSSPFPDVFEHRILSPFYRHRVLNGAKAGYDYPA
ncbi:unnamed protein product, partial [Phaeothamnion confervicola]